MDAFVVLTVGNQTHSERLTLTGPIRSFVALGALVHGLERAGFRDDADTIRAMYQSFIWQPPKESDSDDQAKP